MKICLINRSFSDKVWDGISAYTHYLAQGLAEHDHEVHIITKYSDSNRLIKKESDKIFTHCVTLPWLTKVAYFSKLGEILYSLKVYFKFKEIDKKYHLDIVEAPEAGAESFWLALFTPWKLVTRLHTPLYFYWRFNKLPINWMRIILNLMEKIQAKRSAGLSCPTRALAGKVSQLWQIEKEKIKVIPHPFYPEQFVDYPAKSQDNYILYLGRPERLKGFDILLKAAEIVFGHYPKLKIFLASNSRKIIDNNKDQLQKIILKNKKNLIFLNELDRDKIFSYIKNARLIILPSRWENLPFTLLEAMSLSKVVIASNCGGFKEVIKDGQNGFLFKPGSHQKLAQKIIKCLKLDKKQIQYIKRRAQKTALKFSIPKIIPEMVKFYAKAKLIGALQYNRKEELNWYKKISPDQLQMLLRPNGLWGEGQEIENKGRQKIREIIQELIKRKKGKVSVLDIGCGTGMDYESFKKYKLKVDYTGLDAVPAILNNAQRRYRKGNFLLGEIENLPFPNNSYDIVFTRHVLEHLPGYKKAISELFRVARHIIIIDFFITPTDKPDNIRMHYFRIPSEKFCWIKVYQNYYHKKKLLNYINLFKPQKIEIFENLSRDNKYFDTIYKIIKIK